VKKQTSILTTLAPLGLALTLPFAMLWYYDIFVHWRPSTYPFAVAAVILGNTLLTLLTLWARGERKILPLVWKTALSAAVFIAILIGVSGVINNGIRLGARLAANAAVPLCAAQLLVLFALLLAALWKQNRKGAWALLSAFAALLLGFATYHGMDYARGFAPIQPEITPVFPEARAAEAPIPFEEAEVDEGMETVWLEGGTYAALELTSLSNVIYEARPGEEVVVTGSKEITGWAADQANGAACWSTQVEGGYFTSLYHSDPEKKLSRPRYPAEGYLFVDHTQGARALFTEETTPWEGTLGHSSFFAKEGDLRQFRALEDVTLRILHKWKDEIANLVSFDGGTRELVWERPASMTVEKNERYFLENVFEALKEPGQWYLDREASKLYYIPFEGEDMANTVLYAGMEERLLTVDGASNVVFRGITFRDSAWNRPSGSAFGVEDMDGPQAAIDVNPCVLVTNSTGVRFDQCKFENIGSTALKLGENVHDSGVTNSEFTNIGANAVFIHGNYEKPNSNITVKNNLIAHYGRRFFSAIGVLNIHAHHVEISHNEIYDGYYTGISSGWQWGYGENPTDYVTIENNLIYQIGQGWLSDMGGIYTLGIQEHSVIRGNVIHNVAADPEQGGYGGWGIYLDEGSSGQLVEKNLVYSCGSQSFNMHYGKENLVRNNIFALSREGQASMGSEQEHTTFVLERNIIVSDGQPLYNYLDKSSFRDDGNLYFDYANPRRPFSTRYFHVSPADRMGLPAVRRLGYYRNALFADPLFRDAKNFDFTLALNSPAVTELGFEIWDYSRAGRIKSAPARAPEGGILLNIDINTVNRPFLESVADSASPETAREALRPFVAQYADTQITDLLFCIFCQYSAAPSRVFSTEIDKYLQTGENGIPVDYKEIFRAAYTLSQWGVDPFEAWIAQCRELGIRPWISLRMNDCHDPDEETSWLRSDFFYEAREKGWMIGDDHGYYRYCFDYGVPEVREKMLAYIEEQLMQYDVHGLELDWMREITCFKEQGKPGNVEIMNEFMREVDKLRQDAEQKWGHEIKIMCRLPRDYTQSVAYGFDAAAWAKEGLVDAVVVTPRWETNDSAMPLHQWRAALAGTGVKIHAGLEILTNRASNESHTTARTAQGYAAQYLSAGVDAIYLFNHFQNPNEPNEAFREAYNTCGSMDTLAGAQRRHVVTFQDIAPQGLEPFRPLPMKITKTKPRSLLVHTGSFEAGELTIYLGVAPGTKAEKLSIYLNGKLCEPLGKTDLPEQDTADYLREAADIYAWRARGPFPGGAQSVMVYSGAGAATVSYAEIDIG